MSRSIHRQFQEFPNGFLASCRRERVFRACFIQVLRRRGAILCPGPMKTVRRKPFL